MMLFKRRDNNNENNKDETQKCNNKNNGYINDESEAKINNEEKEFYLKKNEKNSSYNNRSCSENGNIYNSDQNNLLTKVEKNKNRNSPDRYERKYHSNSGTDNELSLIQNKLRNRDKSNNSSVNIYKNRKRKNSAYSNEHNYNDWKMRRNQINTKHYEYKYVKDNEVCKRKGEDTLINKDTDVAIMRKLSNDKYDNIDNRFLHIPKNKYIQTNNYNKQFFEKKKYNYYYQYQNKTYKNNYYQKERSDSKYFYDYKNNNNNNSYYYNTEKTKEKYFYRSLSQNEPYNDEDKFSNTYKNDRYHESKPQYKFDSKKRKRDKSESENRNRKTYRKNERSKSCNSNQNDNESYKENNHYICDKENDKFSDKGSVYEKKEKYETQNVENYEKINKDKQKEITGQYYKQEECDDSTQNYKNKKNSDNFNDSEKGETNHNSYNQDHNKKDNNYYMDKEYHYGRKLTHKDYSICDENIYFETDKKYNNNASDQDSYREYDKDEHAYCSDDSDTTHENKKNIEYVYIKSEVKINLDNDADLTNWVDFDENDKTDENDCIHIKFRNFLLRSYVKSYKIFHHDEYKDTKYIADKDMDNENKSGYNKKHSDIHIPYDSKKYNEKNNDDDEYTNLGLRGMENKKIKTEESYRGENIPTNRAIGP